MGPDPYPERVRHIRMLETHVSYLFFTGKTVYKVKKPVDYGFLDFTTLEKRHFYCLQEVALNSRISPQVYLGVVPICEMFLKQTSCQSLLQVHPSDRHPMGSVSRGRERPLH